jgi:hypothetical protein
MATLLPTDRHSNGREIILSNIGRQAHWENVYAAKDEHAVSWYQERPDISLDRHGAIPKLV